MSYPLIEMAASDFPPSFIRMITEGMPRVYRESKEKVFNDPDYEESDKRYLLPHVRRLHTEKLLRESAEKSGIKTSIEKTSSGMHEYTLVRAGRFSLTACYVDLPNRFPRVATHRTQYAAINNFLPQILLDLDDSNVVQLPTVGDIYAILIHGSEPNNNEANTNEAPAFLRLGIPKHNRASWEDTIDLIEIMETQAIKYQKPEEDMQAQLQEAHPIFKKIPKEEEGT